MRSSFIACFALAGVTACEGGVPVHLTMSQLNGTPAGQQKSGLSAADSDRAFPSSTNFSYAVVSGIRLRMNEIRFEAADGDGTISLDRDLELGFGVSNTTIDLPASLPAKAYRMLVVNHDNAFSVKAFCRTNDSLVYTAADGSVKKQPCAPSESCAVPDDDYGYVRYPFAIVSSAESPTSNSDHVDELTTADVTVDPLGGTEISLLIDTSFLVTCYDGDLTSWPMPGRGDGDGLGRLGPFNSQPNVGTTQDYFPVDKPAFGLNSYLPVFTWVTDDGTAPQGETYLISYDPEKLAAPAPPFQDLTVTTFAFKSDGTIYQARSRIDSGRVDLNQFFSNFERNMDGTYSFENGELATGDTARPDASDVAYSDRKIDGWRRLELTDPPAPSALNNGPDCGNTTLYFGHPGELRAKPCMSRSESIYWKRYRRAD